MPDDKDLDAPARNADKQDKNTTAIRVTLVGADSLVLLRNAASVGDLLMPNGDVLSPLEFFEPIGMDGFDDGMTIVIVNCLENTLSLHNQLIDAGWPLLRPGTFDQPAHDMYPHRIPGKRTDPVTPGAFLYGVGCYRFKRSWTTGCGALSFSYNQNSTNGDAPPFIGIAWQEADLNGGPGSGLTTDMEDYSYDLPTFFSATASKHTHTLVAAGKEVKLTGMVASRNSHVFNCAVLTVMVEPV